MTPMLRHIVPAILLVILSEKSPWMYWGKYGSCLCFMSLLFCDSVSLCLYGSVSLCLWEERCSCDVWLYFGRISGISSRKVPNSTKRHSENLFAVQSPHPPLEPCLLWNLLPNLLQNLLMDLPRYLLPNLLWMQLPRRSPTSALQPPSEKQLAFVLPLLR